MNRHWVSIDSAAHQGASPASFNILAFLFHRKATILGVFLTLFLLATALLYLLPPSYEAEANLLVERNRSPIMRADILPGLEMAEVMNTARGIASSRTVMESVVDTLKLVERQQTQGIMSGLKASVNHVLVGVGLLPDVNPRDTWILSLMEWVTIKPIVNSNILTISIAHDDPKLATEIVNEISVQYIKQHLKIYSTRGLAGFYKDRLDSAEAEYKAARDKMIAFKANASLFAIAASREEYTRELGTLRSQILTSTNDLNRTLQRYDGQHPDAVVLKNVITAIETRIADTETKLKKLEYDEATLSDMEMLLETRRKTYLDYVHKYGEASINEQADPDVVNVRLIEQATVPPQPWMPRLYLIIGAAIVSALLAVAAAFFRSYFDSRPTTSQEIENALRVPVVGGVEELSKDKVFALCAGRQT